MAKEYVPIFLDWLEVTEKLTAQQKGYLIDALVQTFQDGRQYILDSNSPEELVAVYCKLVGVVNSFLSSAYNGRSGAFHWNWKGGKTPINQRERSSKAYTEWRKAVFVRDNFTCQICGQVGGKLNAHHIKRWSTNVIRSKTA